MPEPMSWIRTLYDYSRGESDRCIKACANARCEGGAWSCPLFVNVDKVVVVSERGVVCRKFKRREE